MKRGRDCDDIDIDFGNTKRHCDYNMSRAMFDTIPTLNTEEQDIMSHEIKRLSDDRDAIEQTLLYQQGYIQRLEQVIHQLHNRVTELESHNGSNMNTRKEIY